MAGKVGSHIISWKNQRFSEILELWHALISCRLHFSYLLIFMMAKGNWLEALKWWYYVKIYWCRGLQEAKSEKVSSCIFQWKCQFFDFLCQILFNSTNEVIMHFCNRVIPLTSVLVVDSIQTVCKVPIVCCPPLREWMVNCGKTFVEVLMVTELKNSFFTLFNNTFLCLAKNCTATSFGVMKTIINFVAKIFE